MKTNLLSKTGRIDPCPVLEPTPIASWMDLVPSLRKKLAELGYEGTKVIIRHYDRDRTELVRTKGTDRDEDSRVWDYREDSCHWRSKEPVKAADITYARTLDLSQEPVCPIPFCRNSIDSFGNNLDYLAHLPHANGMAVYDPERLKRVSPNEYQFTDNPRDALIAIFLVSKDQRSQ